MHLNKTKASVYSYFCSILLQPKRKKELEKLPFYSYKEEAKSEVI